MCNTSALLDHRELTRNANKSAAGRRWFVRFCQLQSSGETRAAYCREAVRHPGARTHRHGACQCWHCAGRSRPIGPWGTSSQNVVRNTITLRSGRQFDVQYSRPTWRPAPLIVMLPGLNQTPALFEAATQAYAFGRTNGITIAYGYPAPPPAACPRGTRALAAAANRRTTSPICGLSSPPPSRSRVSTCTASTSSACPTAA